VRTKTDNPAIPVTPAEQVESAHAAFEAGATVCHIHVRDDQQRNASDVERYRLVKAGLAEHCPGMVTSFSTSTRGSSPEGRRGPLELGPDFAALAPGSTNFAGMPPNNVYTNTPEEVEDLAQTMQRLGVRPECELFTFAMLYTVAGMVEAGLVPRPPYLNLVLNATYNLPGRETIVDFFVSEMREVLPDAQWLCMAPGRFGLQVSRWSLERGGHARTGLEDTAYYERGRLVSSNAELVERLVQVCAECGRRPATVAETRHMLGLDAATVPDPTSAASSGGRT
jgi:3-keto-5-aminohexanoate cleavage enzyme